MKDIDEVTYSDLVAKYGGRIQADRAVALGTIHKDFPPEIVEDLENRLYMSSQHRDFLLIDLLEEVRDLLKAKAARDMLS